MGSCYSHETISKKKLGLPRGPSFSENNHGSTEMIPSSRPSYSFRELKASLFHSPEVIEIFERELARYFNIRHAITFPYGRSALYSALKAIGKTGGEVIQPAYNCVVVAHATVMAGYRPVFVDTALDAPNQDPQQMIDQTTSQTVAAVPTSIFGMTFDAAHLCEAIRRRNQKVLIFIDGCQCFDAKWNGQMLTECGDGAFLAFGIGKPMTTLYGGAFLTNQKNLAQSVRRYRDATFLTRPSTAKVMRWFYFVASWMALATPFVRFTNLMMKADTSLRRYFLTLRAQDAIRLPGNHETMMLPMEASIGREQLSRVATFMSRRKEIASIYNREFGGLTAIELLPWTEGSTYTIYTVKLKRPEDRPCILASLRGCGIQGETIFNYVIPGLDCYRERGYSSSPFPRSLNWADRVLNLPNHPTMTEKQVQTVVRALKKILGEMHA
jgi:perosamine synthetase